ncbi:PTS system mannose/fructose/sorbose family transporter subunit IID [Faecalicoccus sp. LCP19S3_E3]|uniref:PTS system mannose/fructose/sorbose family transporter subunit IID n=1 Tax=unclassified Faecalicoccus TaxID=2643311 RepID=UPI0025F5DC8A|nr:PTS system mannose/fructose/sorbose family transporter subunit IID [uncultured Faecalicoccus sp.]
MITNSSITKSDLRKVFTRSCTLDSAWNYERQQNLMYCYSMIPILKRLYGDDKEKMAEALQRHLEFMSCTPHIVTLLMGITSAMEEENKNTESFDASSISAVKTSLMGPMAGIGDSFFWGTLLTIAIGVAVSFSQQGSIIGPISFLLIINIPGFLARFYCLKTGFKFGVKFFGDAKNQQIIENITKAASILGLMVIGAMIATTVNITIPLEIGVEGATQPLQTYLDQIMPCLLPCITFGLMYWLLGKNVKPTMILMGLIIISCIGTFIGIF